MVPSVTEIARNLASAGGTDGEPLLTQEEAERRATALADECRVLRFELRLFPWKNGTWAGKACPYPAYWLDDPRFDLNKIGPGEKGQFAFNAPGISCGDLLRFGRACEIKQQYFPSAWPKGIKDGLRDHQSHLDALEEVLWLGRFQGLQNVRNKVVHPNGLDADWEFTSCTLPLQIEVKNRRKEYSGITDGGHSSRDFPGWWDDFRGKFSRSTPGALNLACLTTYFDEPVHERASELLNAGENVDALVVWSYHCLDGEHLRIYGPPAVKALIATTLAPIRREESRKVILIKHLMRNTAEQRVATMEEVVRAFTQRG